MRKLNGVEKQFSKFCYGMLNMTQVKYTTDTIIPYRTYSRYLTSKSFIQQVP